MTINFDVQVIDSTDAIREIEDDWNALIQFSTRPSFYATFDYIILATEQLIEKSRQIYFVLLRESPSKQLLAIFPMSVHKRLVYGSNIRVLEHVITAENSDVDKPYPIIHSKYEEECWNEFRLVVQNKLTNWDWLEYEELIPDSSLNISLSRLFSWPRFIPRQLEGPSSPILDFSGSWDEYWNAHRKMRKKCRRLENHLGGALRFEVISEKNRIIPCLDEYIELENKGWKSNIGLSHPINTKFYHSLFTLLSDKGKIVFGMLYDRNKLISAEIAYVDFDKVYFAHGSYDPDYEKFSPGKVSTARFIEHFFSKNYNFGDFLAGYADYLEPWATRIEYTKYTVVYKVNGNLFRVFIGRIKAKIKSIIRRLWKADRNED